MNVITINVIKQYRKLRKTKTEAAPIDISYYVFRTASFLLNSIVFILKFFELYISQGSHYLIFNSVCYSDLGI